MPLVTFAGRSPPWSLAELDANFAFLNALIAANTAGYHLFPKLKDVADASAPESFTGCGFTPKCAVMIGEIGGTTTFSIGIATPVAQRSILMTGGGAAWASQISTIAHLATNAGATNVQSAVLSSFDADGITLSWTKTGTPTGSAQCLILVMR